MPLASSASFPFPVSAEHRPGHLTPTERPNGSVVDMTSKISDGRSPGTTRTSFATPYSQSSKKSQRSVIARQCVGCDFSDCLSSASASGFSGPSAER